MIGKVELGSFRLKSTKPSFCHRFSLCFGCASKLASSAKSEEVLCGCGSLSKASKEEEEIGVDVVAGASKGSNTVLTCDGFEGVGSLEVKERPAKSFDISTEVLLLSLPEVSPLPLPGVVAALLLLLLLKRSSLNGLDVDADARGESNRFTCELLLTDTDWLLVCLGVGAGVVRGAATTGGDSVAVSWTSLKGSFEKGSLPIGDPIKSGAGGAARGGMGGGSTLVVMLIESRFCGLVGATPPLMLLLLLLAFGLFEFRIASARLWNRSNFVPSIEKLYTQSVTPMSTSTLKIRPGQLADCHPWLKSVASTLSVDVIFCPFS